MTQLTTGENELIVGGGFGSVGDQIILKQIGDADDSGWDKTIAAHLSGAMPVYFKEANWGAEKPPQQNDEGMKWDDGRVKANWSGIISLSADSLPWVGRLPDKLSGRKSSTPVWKFTAEPKDEDALPALTNLTSTPGEWISASYSGEGMVHAWLCAKALAYMVLDAEEDGGLKEWFPEVMRVTEERWKKANVDDLLEELGGDS